MQDAFYIITHLLPQNLYPGAIAESLQGIVSPFQAFTVVGFVAVMELVHFFQRNRNPVHVFYERHVSVRYACYLFLLVSILMFGVTGNETAFIYFQF